MREYEPVENFWFNQKPTLIDVYSYMRPNCTFTVVFDDDGGVLSCEYEDPNVPKPTREEIDHCSKKLFDYYAENAHVFQRAPMYPSIGDQLDALYHAGVFPPEMAARIAAVKEQFPKPNEASGNL